MTKQIKGLNDRKSFMKPPLWNKGFPPFQGTYIHTYLHTYIHTYMFYLFGALYNKERKLWSPPKSETSGYSFVSYGFSQKQHKPAINLQIRNRTLLGWTGSPVAIPLISECYWPLLEFLDIQCCFKHLPQKFVSTLFRCAFSIYLVSLIRQPKSSPDLDFKTLHFFPTKECYTPSD